MTHTLPWQKPDPVKNYYPVPKVICQLGLSPGEIAVYSFLLFCEDRKTYQCYPSYRTIGNAVGMSRNTVCKYVRSLEEKGLIRTERTTITLKDGRKRNGSLLYTILPVEQVLAQHNQHQLHLAEMTAERHRAQQKLAAQAEEPPCSPL
jgi:predicted transcriptional regulator